MPHPYLAAKGFPDARALVVAKDNLLLVPMRNMRTGTVQSLQTITPDGAKKLLPGGRAKGVVYNLGQALTRWYVEGYATGLSVQAALKRMYRQDQVVVCFSAGNLAHVAPPGGPSPRQRYVIVDNDASGTGEKYAAKTGCPIGCPGSSGMPTISIRPTASRRWWRRYGRCCGQHKQVHGQARQPDGRAAGRRTPYTERTCPRSHAKRARPTHRGTLNKVLGGTPSCLAACLGYSTRRRGG